MTTPGRRTALVTGGNRGIGREIVRQLAERGLNVVLTARDLAAARQSAEQIRGSVLAEQLDVSDPHSVSACAQRLIAQDIDVDVLVNNAAIYTTTPLLAIDEHQLHETVDVNLLGAWRTSRELVPAMRERGWGRVVNISTGYAHIADGAPQAGAYGLSKAGLNALTRMIAAEAGPAVKVNCMSPGWVASGMGGVGAPVSVEEGADTAVWLATLPDDGPTDGFFYERKQIRW